jgi:MFS family permease
VGTLTGSFALPVVGHQIDRRGPRLIMTITAVLFGLACIYMGVVLNAVMLVLGFTAIRMLGQGSLALVSKNVINQWWVRRRGTMMGISGLLVSLLGIGGFPSLINWLIPIYGWRITYMLLGLMLLLILLPLTLLFVRDQPEQYGLHPDGTIPTFSGDNPAGTTVSQIETPEENWTLQEALRTPIYWIFTFGMASTAMLSTGLFFHMVSIFEDNGLSPTVAASVFVPIAATTAIVNLGGGILVDRISIRLLMAVALFLQTSSLLMAQFLQSIEVAFMYGMIMGTTMGLIGIINSVSWAKYFGRKHLGSISGLTTTILVAGSALGPVPFGFTRDLLGSYSMALTICAIIPFVLAIASLFVNRPQKSDSPETPEP